MRSILANIRKLKSIHIYSEVDIGKDWYLILIITISTLVYGSVPAITSILTGASFSLLQKLAGGDYDSLNDLMHDLTLKAMAILVTGVGSIPMCWLSIALWMNLGERQGFRLRRKMLNTYMVKPLEWYDGNEQLSGSFIQLNRCVEELRSSSAEASAIIFQNLATVISLLITAFYFSWSLTLVIIANSPLVIGFAIYFSRLIETFTRLENAETLNAADILAWSMNAARTVRIFCTQEIESIKFHKSITASKRHFVKSSLYSSANYAILRFLTLCMFVQGFWFGNTMIKAKRLEVGDVITCFSACILLASTLNNTMHQIVTVQKGAVAIETLFKFVEKSKPKIEIVQLENGPSKLLPLGDCDVVFENVTFEYPTRSSEKVLKRVNLVFPANKTTFIVGKSGSGKSTIVNLLLKFYNSTSGSITIGGHSLENIDTNWLLENVTVVEQCCTLFNDTIKNNIILDNNCSFDQEESLKRACQTAMLDRVLHGLVLGWDTMLGPSGEGLSGGEQQRVALARAIMRNTPILILDEALSAQDTIHRRLLMDAIKIWRKGKTTIILTHELNDILDSDYLYLFEDGKTEECGYKSALSGDFSSKFFQLQKWQKCSNDDDSFLTLNDHHSPETDSKKAFVCQEVEEIISDAETPIIDRPPSPFHSENFLSPEKLIRNSADILRDQLMRPPKRRKLSASRMDSSSYCNTLTNQDLEKNMSKPKPLSLPRIVSKMYATMTIKYTLLLGLVFSVCCGVTNPLFSYTFSKLLNGIVPEDSNVGSPFYLKKWSLIVLSIALLDSLFTFLKCFILSYCSESWIMNLRMMAMRKNLTHNIEWFSISENDTSKVSSLVLNDLRDLRSLASEFLAAVTTLIVVSLCGLIWAIASGWKLSLVCISLLLVFVVFFGFYGCILQRYEADYKTAVAELENQLYQTIKNMRTIRSLQLQMHFSQGYDKTECIMNNIARKRALATGLGVALANALTLVTQAIMIYYGIKLVIIGEYTSGKMFQTFTLLLFTIMTCLSLVSQIPEISRGQRAATYIFKILSDPTPEDNSSYRKRSSPFNKHKGSALISINDLRFSYPPDYKSCGHEQNCLNVYRGEVIGIVGETGSGKSTLCNYLTALYGVSNGKIYFDDTDINNWNINKLRAQISVVEQKPEFFYGSIKDNLTYGTDHIISDSEIMSVLELVGLVDFINTLPRKLETAIVNDLMSGGQVQRLAIARAFLRKPRILILDECTSSLDALHAHSIAELVKSGLGGITTIVVTHHEQLMRSCDRIITLRAGNIVEKGSFNELFEQRGELYRIVTKGSS